MNFIITNREIIINPDGTESIREDGRDSASSNLRFGEYNLTDRNYTIYPDPIKQQDLLYDTNLSVNDKGSALFFKKLYGEILKSKGDKKTKDGKPKADVLFYIHGFNNDLKGVRGEFEKLHDAYVANDNSPIAHIVIFSWPSQSTPIGVPIPFSTYFDDQKDAERSGETLARGINKLGDFYKFYFRDKEFCGQKIHLMAHSMGNQVLGSAMESFGKKTLELFGEIILVAADISYNAFEKKEPFQYLIDMGERVHIFYHEHDKALEISKHTKNGNNRLGSYGRRDKKTTTDINEINVSKTNSTLGNVIQAVGNHHYHIASDVVIADIVKILKGL